MATAVLLDRHKSVRLRVGQSNTEAELRDKQEPSARALPHAQKRQPRWRHRLLRRPAQRRPYEHLNRHDCCENGRRCC